MSDTSTATAQPAAASTSGSVPERLTDAQYEALSPSERLQYGRQFSQNNLPSDTPEPAKTDKPGDKPATQEALKTEGGKYRFGDIELTDAEIRDLVAHKSAMDSRKLAAPQSPDAYEVKTSPAFKVPDGLALEFKIDTNNPLWSQAKTWAHKNGLSQEAFMEAIDIVAGRDLFTHQQVQHARNGEVAKLGTTGPARIDALEKFYAGLLGSAEAKVMMSRVFTAADVRAHEKIVSRFATQGHASFSAAHREPGEGAGRVDDATYAAMTPREKFSYARQFSGARR